MYNVIMYLIYFFFIYLFMTQFICALSKTSERLVTLAVNLVNLINQNLLTTKMQMIEFLEGISLEIATFQPLYATMYSVRLTLLSGYFLFHVLILLLLLSI